jgi:branched-subunit amino acid aminotransferase/4-amino-4-deoxychorismate lyase
MAENWMRDERMKEAQRERVLEKERVVYIQSDLYPKGEFVPELEARLTVFDRGFTIGDSAYEYARTYNHKPFQVSKHMERMFSSLKVMRINPGLSIDEFCALCEGLTKRNLPLLQHRVGGNPRGVGVAWPEDSRSGRSRRPHRNY